MMHLNAAKNVSGIETDNNHNEPLGLVDTYGHGEVLGLLRKDEHEYYFEPNGLPLTQDNLEALYVFFRELNREFK